MLKILNEDFTNLEKNVSLKMNFLIKVLQKQNKILKKFRLINESF